MKITKINLSHSWKGLLLLIFGLILLSYPVARSIDSAKNTRNISPQKLLYYHDIIRSSDEEEIIKAAKAALQEPEILAVSIRHAQEDSDNLRIVLQKDGDILWSPSREINGYIIKMSFAPPSPSTININDLYSDIEISLLTAVGFMALFFGYARISEDRNGFLKAN